MSAGPVQDVTFGAALSITLDSYYDVLKKQSGGIGSNEHLQLKLVADSIDISKDDYPWFSLLNLYQRSDQAIEPSPTTDAVTVTAVTLHAVYAEFLDKLVKYVVVTALSAADQQKVDGLMGSVKSWQRQNQAWDIDDYQSWKAYAAATGRNVGNTSDQLDWAQNNGNGEKIAENRAQIAIALFQIRQTLQTQYQEPGDKDIIQAYNDYNNPAMYMGYPIGPDYTYDDQKYFSREYLAGKVDSGRFLFRPVIGWDKTLDFMQTKAAGVLSGHFDSQTATSTSIVSDWGGSASVSYAFISVSASASEHTAIQEDFKHGTSIDISSEASYQVGLIFPDWFHPELFKCQRVTENIHDFVKFFGPTGTLLYYPTKLVCIRGFKAVFHSSQDWTYDYDHKFSASAVGRFSMFGIGFGGSASYSNEQKQHTVSTSHTDLTLADDASTIRFVGYVLAKNTVFQDNVSLLSVKALKRVADDVTLTAKGKEPPTSGHPLDSENGR